MTKDSRKMSCSELGDGFDFEKDIKVIPGSNNELEIQMKIDTSRPIKWMKEGKFEYNLFLLIFDNHIFDI